MIISRLGNKAVRFGKTIFYKLGFGEDIAKSTIKESEHGFGFTLNPLTHDTVQISTKSNRVGKVLPMDIANRGPNLLQAYESNGDFQYLNGSKLFEIEEMSFVDTVNPKILKKAFIPKGEKVIFVSNFEDIKGTIAATTDLNKCIATDRMYQCAGMTIVDRSLNKQTLIHVFPGMSVEANEKIIKEVLGGSKPENLEISIIPGCRYYTESTVAFLADITNKLAPKSKINYYNLPARIPFHKATPEQVRFLEGESAIWLKDGKLYCCNNNEIHNKKVNPKEFLTYFE
ncbi:MAG: hypothetical protein ACI37Q_07255 [Candidatus Gastranaerophilaceae bacterium]